MECDICHERPASIHLTNYVNGQKEEKHVCNQCAVEEGYISEEETYPIHDLLSGLFNFNPPLKKKVTLDKKESGQVCPTCHMSYQEFIKHYKFGCADCYKTFETQLDPVLRRVHNGNTEHVGKVPKRQHVHLEQKRKINDLKEQLKQHIEDERFEDAAVLRDEIRALVSPQEPADSDKKEEK